jgi:excisionase family DNA binding protein
LTQHIAEAIEQWWDIRSAARYLSVSVAFLRKAVRQKRVPFARAGSKNLRFRKSELDEWMKANSCGGRNAAALNVNPSGVPGVQEIPTSSEPKQ